MYRMKNGKRTLLICILAVAILGLAVWAVWPKGDGNEKKPQPTATPAVAEVPATEVPAIEVRVTDAPTQVAAVTAVPATDEPAAEQTLAEADPVPDDAVLATVNGEAVTALDADDAAYMLYQYGYTQNYPDYDLAVSYLIQQAVIRNHLEKSGYMQFTQEEETAFANEANAEWEAMLDDYVKAYLSEDTEEARQTLRQQAGEYYAANGVSVDAILGELRLREATAHMEADLTGGYEPTPEDIREVFELYGPQYQEQYENNVGMYEIYTNYYGYESWYVPEGYRAVLHILLEADEELISAYTAAQAAYDEAASDEDAGPEALEEARKAMEEARAAVIASRQEVIDEISQRIEKGESFQSLIAEYNTDPGMRDENTLAEGYRVHRESVLWVPAFIEGAFQEEMRKPGDVSTPVVSNHGVHILYYLADVPGGLIMTDSIEEEIREYLVSDRLNTAFSENYAEWEKQMEIVRDDALIARLAAEAQAEQEALQEQPLQQAPEADGEEGAAPEEETAETQQ